MTNANKAPKTDLFSDISDLDSVRFLLAELHDDLKGVVARFRYLADLGNQLGRNGTMLSGGAATYNAWIEARSSFIHGNFIATIFLCQSLVENLLASYLREGLCTENLPEKIAFRETLRLCKQKKLIEDAQIDDLLRLVGLRNPLSHYRDFEDDQNIDIRAVNIRIHPNELLRQDAWFAIGVAVRILAMPPFRLG